MVYFFVRLFTLIFLKLYLNFKVIGRRHVPSKGAFILAANHSSYIDPPLVAASVKRGLYFMARAKLFEIPIMGWIIKHAHSFPVKRSGRDVASLKTSLKILREQKGLVIFPEGVRTKNKLLKRAKPGAGFLVYKARVPVIPAYIKGTFDAMPRKASTLKKHPVSIYIGKPINLDKFYASQRGEEVYQKISDEIMHQIGKLKEMHEK